jgi:hypothetical protein
MMARCATLVFSFRSLGVDLQQLAFGAVLTKNIKILYPKAYFVRDEKWPHAGTFMASYGRDEFRIQWKHS